MFNAAACFIEPQQLLFFFSHLALIKRKLYGSCATKGNFSAAVLSDVKMVFSAYVKQRILFYHQQGSTSRAIRNLLLGEGIIVSHVGVYCFLKRFETHGTISRRHGSGRPSKITEEVKRIVEAQMQLDDETTATQLRSLLAQKGA